MEEVWRETEWSRYEISNLGRLRSLDRRVEYKDGRVGVWKGKILKPGCSGNGYLVASLGGGARQLVHRLVAVAFLPRKGSANIVNHIDGDKLNNRVDNLEWGTYQSNNHHARLTGLNNQNGENCNLTTIPDRVVRAMRRVHEMYSPSMRELAMIFEVGEAQVGSIISLKSRTKT